MLEALQRGLEVEARGLDPSPHRHLVADHTTGSDHGSVVQADDDPVRPALGQPGQHLGPLHGHGSDDDPRDAGLEQLSCATLVADPSAGLHRHRDRRRDGEHEGPVRGAAVAGGIEIDDVQPRGPSSHERLRLLERVAVHGLGGELAPEQAHAPARPDVDGGPQLQVQRSEPSSQIRAKRSSSRSPAEADFSGWNWVPNRFPRSKATAISPP